MNPHEYIEILDKDTQQVLLSVKAIPAKQLAYMPEGKWSALQILEHIYLTERLVLLLASRSSAIVSEKANIVGNDNLRRGMVELRERKIEAPDAVKPKGDLKTIPDFEKKFSENRAVLKERLLSGQIAIDGRVHKHPLIGEMTIGDWLHFLIHHTQRHLLQLNDLCKEAEKFS